MEQLNITDLQNIQAIINMASIRGAFKGDELSFVGHTYDRLSAFLESASGGAGAGDNSQSVGDQPVQQGE